MVEQAPLKRKVTGSSPVWPTLFLLVFPSAALPAAAPAPKPAAAVEQETAEIPAGTLLSIELVDPVSSAKNAAGDSFRGRVLDGVYSKGRVAVPPGSTVRGTVMEAKKSGRFAGQSRLAVTLSSIEVEGSTAAVVSDSLSYLGDPHAGKNIGSVLGGALQGAVMGVLFGGGNGAMIGAGAGAGAGALGNIMKGKQDVSFEPGARLLFETKEAFSVPVYPPAVRPAPPPPPDGKPGA